MHGGNLSQEALRLGCRSEQLLDASASLLPLRRSKSLDHCLHQALAGGALRNYPDCSHHFLRQAIAQIHEVDSSLVLPGNGAAELFTWAARDASGLGTSLLPFPGFADYSRALNAWGAAVRPVSLPLDWSDHFPQPLPCIETADVLWICNPHNPTGQLWSRASLEPLLERYRLVICDEAFLPLVPHGEAQSLIPLVETHANLVVIRSLTKLYGIAGLRLGYALAQPERLQRWSEWRDPWPVNGIAAAVGEGLLRDPCRYASWCCAVQRWTATEGAWLQRKLMELPDITPMPSSANFLLIRAQSSLVDLRESLATRHRILLRDCRSFAGLGENWLRIGYQSRRHNRRIMSALRRELKRQPLA